MSGIILWVLFAIGILQPGLSLKRQIYLPFDNLSPCPGFAEWIKCNTNDACVHASWVCDGMQQCGDGTDEPTACDSKTCSKSKPFPCANGERCIRLLDLCDSIDDCGDGSDETELLCGRVSLTATPPVTTTTTTTATPPVTTTGITPRTTTTTATTTAQFSQCPPGFFTSESPFSGNCYMLVTEVKDWFMAQKFCASVTPGSHLIFIESNEEQSFIYSMISRQQEFMETAWWIGGARNNHAWEWKTYSPTREISGKSMEYTNWATSEPNNKGAAESCVALMSMYWWDGRWNDDVCDKQRRFICEYTMQV